MPAQYYFDELDPAGFQRLVNALLLARYGEGIRLLPLRGSDGGRDAETPPGSAYFSVYIPPTEGTRDPISVRPGRYIFQVKQHRTTDRPGAVTRAAVIQDFVDELSSNILPREEEDKVDYFFLITNVPSSRDSFEKLDQKRNEYLRGRPGLHAEVLWQEHLIAWLDQAASVWSAFPELFAGRVTPYLGKIAEKDPKGLPLSIRIALSAQFSRDAIVRFRQVNLEQRLSNLFVDLDARQVDVSPHFFYQHQSSYEMVAVDDFPMNASPDGYMYEPGALSLLTSERSTKLAKIILEGGPGQGKSTVTQMLVQIYRSLLVGSTSEYRSYSAQVRRARFPIRIELRLFAEWLGNNDGSVEQYLAELFTKDAGGAKIEVEDLQQALHKQDVLLIFDGLDEVGSESLRDDVVAKIADSVTRFEGAGEAELRVIVTSRPPAIAGRLDALKEFKRVQLQPLSEGRVEKYVDRWTDVLCSDRPDRERVLSSFAKRRTEDHVAALAKNPMQLSVLLHFIRLKGEAFPDKRAELYREYFKTVIDRDVEKSPALRLHRDDIETLHEVIGFEIHSRAENDKAGARLTRPDLIKLVRSWFESQDRRSDTGENLFRIGEERLGLIVALSGEGLLTQYGFEIQPVREYFAAAFINDKCEANAHDLFGMMIRRPFWKEVARFLAGLRRANERADLLSRARELDEEIDAGWRSDGLTIIGQLLQEGVLTIPGHVHRDALAFVMKILDLEDDKARVLPKDLLSNLPKLIRSCDSEQPRMRLRALLKHSRGSEDRQALHRLWTTCLNVFDSAEILQEMCS